MLFFATICSIQKVVSASTVALRFVRMKPPFELLRKLLIRRRYGSAYSKIDAARAK